MHRSIRVLLIRAKHISVYTPDHIWPCATLCHYEEHPFRKSRIITRIPRNLHALSVLTHPHAVVHFHGPLRLVVSTRKCLSCRLHYWDLRWRSRQSKRLSPLRSWVRFSLRTPVKKESVNALPKVVSFLRVPRFPSTGKVDRVVRINKRQIVYKTNNVAENMPVVIC